jgi:transaldolase
MLFFVDTAEIADIKKLHEMGLLDGVTTNPSLVAKSGRDFKDVIKEICAAVPGPVSAEVADNVVVKVPLTVDGLRATRSFADKGIKTNVTLCFSPNQALLAAKCGATYVSPFLGRLDDINLDGVELIEQIRQIYDNYDFATKILAASIRSPNHVTQVALAGADVATIPPAVIYKLADHPLTKAGLDQFVKDWKATGQSIL